MASLHARHVQNVLDEAIHAGRGALDRFGGLSRSTLWFRAAALKKTGLHRDGTERISKVMSDETEHLITDLGCLDRSIVETGILDRDGRSVRERLGQTKIALARSGESGEETNASTPRSCPCLRSGNAIIDVGLTARSACRCSGPWATDSSSSEVTCSMSEGLFRVDDGTEGDKGAARSSGTCSSTAQSSALDGSRLTTFSRLSCSCSLDDLDDAPVGEITNDQMRDGRQRLLVVERRRQHGSRFGQKLLLLLDALAFRDVSQRHGEEGLVADLQLRDRRLGRESPRRSCEDPRSS